MASIDERIVRMKFDNSSFASGVSQTQGLLSRLKNLLNFKGATQSLNELDAAGKKLNFNGIGDGLSQVGSKFTALSALGIAAFAAIGFKAVQVGTQIAQSFTVAPIMDGFREYETKMGSIQTILANTSQSGTTLADVNKSLDSLNDYADKTIYSFADMTKNIGLFTNAGIGIEDATSMIKGFSNEAAASGTNAQGAAGAAYQLSQALSTGTIRLMDWKSLSNVGMGNKNMQKGLIQIADAMGVFSEKGLDAETVGKDFNASLEDKWLTADVMQNYLKMQAGELSKEQMRAIGLTDKQIDAFMKQQKIAEDAATKVRTFTQLIGTMREAIGSSWAESFGHILGDFNDATDLFTGISEAFGGIIGRMGDRRNAMLSDWVKEGGRAAAIDGLANAGKALLSVLKPIGEAFRDIFPPMTGARLAEISKSFRDFTQGLILSSDSADKLKRTFRGVFAIFDIAKTIIFGVVGVLADLFGVVFDGAGSFLDITAAIGDFLVGLRDAIKSGDGLKNFFSGLGTVLAIPIKLLQLLGGLVVDVFKGLGNMDMGGLEGIGDRMKARFSSLGNLGDIVAKVWDGLGKSFQRIGEFLRPAIEQIQDFFGKLGGYIADGMQDMNFDKALDLINTGLFAAIALAIRKFLKGGLNLDGGILSSITESFQGLTGVLSAMQANIKADALIKIAIAIGILTASVVALSMIDSGKLTSALVGLTAMLTQLGIASAVFQYTSTTFGAAKLGVIATALILLSTAVGILTISVKALSDLDWGGLAKGLLGVTVLLGALAISAGIMSKNAGGLITAGIGMIAVAAAIKILSSAVEDFAQLDFAKMMQGLIGVGSLLVGLAIFTRLAAVNKGALASGAGLILLGAALKIMASAVADFGNMDLPKMQAGLIAIGAVLGAIALFSLVTANAGMTLRTAAALVILGAALNIMADAVGSFADMQWDALVRGLTGMAGALVLITAAMWLIPPNMIFTAGALVIVAAALKIVAGVLQTMAGMTWDEIGRGFVVLGGALVILAAGMYAMSGTLLGAAALIVAAGALRLLAPALVMLGGMAWDEIGRGLFMLAAAMTVIGIAGVLLTPVVPTLIGLGIAVGLLGVGMLAAGAGLMAFGIGLTMTAAAGAAAAGVIIGAVRGLLELIPFAFRKVGEGVIELANIIGRGGPAITRAFVAIIESILNAVNRTAPLIISTMENLVSRMLQSIVRMVPQFVSAGMAVIMGLLNGINRNIASITRVAMQIMINFINAIRSQLPALSSAGVQLVISFVNSVANGIRANQGAMNAAGRNLGEAIVSGMIAGVTGGLSGIVSAARNLASSAYEAAKAALKSKSPSKKMIEVGRDFDLGFQIGINKHAAGASTAASNMANNTLGAVARVMSNFDPGMELDLNPTITPVLDLTEFRKEAAQMDVKAPVLTAGASYSRAATLSAQARQAGTTLADGRDVVAQEVTHLEYTQNIHSPKAVSRAEIYRDTNNQLSRFKSTKGALVTK